MMMTMTELAPILGALMLGGLPFALLLIIRSRKPAPWEIEIDDKEEVQP